MKFLSERQIHVSQSHGYGIVMIKDGSLTQTYNKCSFKTDSQISKSWCKFAAACCPLVISVCRQGVVWYQIGIRVKYVSSRRFNHQLIAPLVRNVINFSFEPPKTTTYDRSNKLWQGGSNLWQDNYNLRKLKPFQSLFLSVDVRMFCD